MVYKQPEQLIFGCSSAPRFARAPARANAAALRGDADRQSTCFTANTCLLSILSGRLRWWQQPLEKWLEESRIQNLLSLAHLDMSDLPRRLQSPSQPDGGSCSAGWSPPAWKLPDHGHLSYMPGFMTNGLAERCYAMLKPRISSCQKAACSRPRKEATSHVSVC